MRLMIILLILALSATAAMAAGSVSAPTSLQLTVYNSDFALVRDTRTITLDRGLNSIEVQDVSAKIDPTSILFRSITAPNSVSILEQNYQYDLISPDNILNKSVGSRVTFTNFDSSGRPYIQSGIIMNPISNGGLVIRADDGSIMLRPEGQVSLERMPDGLHPRPTINWLLQSNQAGAQQSEICYLTDGIGWKADYVALINENDTALDLAGWVTLNNRSGTSYENANLTLMAGDVRRATPQMDKVYARSMMLEAAAAPQFEEKSFFEYHMYTMQRPTTIRDKETKQLSLLNASEVGVKKELIFDGRGNWWRSWWYPGRRDYDPGRGQDTSTQTKLNIVLEVVNSQENRMGMPLPNGKVRVYKLDDTGAQQFIGEDTIDHTPKDEKIRLYIGDAFDVVGEHKRTNYRKIGDRVVEESFEVTIRNHKDTAEDVKVVEYVWSDWTVLQSSHTYVKKDARTIEFPINVPANGETKIIYTIRTTW